MQKRTPPSLGRFLTHAREDVGITTSEAARRLRLSQPAVHQWESDTTVPELSRVGDIARVYEASEAMVRTLIVKALGARPPRRKAS